MRFKKNPESGDPSSIQQSFEKIDINVHCCRYWWMKRWRHQRLSYPYWRLYWNKTAGGYVYFEEKVFLEPERLIVIPPHTPFSTDILDDEPGNSGDYCMEGGWINQQEREQAALEEGYIPHLYIHFNLGYAFDNMPPAIYSLPADADQLSSIEVITGHLKQGNRDFGFRESLEIYNLISSSIKRIPGGKWGSSDVGSGILEIINYIRRHMNDPIDNTRLAGIATMAPNSFARLFRQQTGQTPQAYIRKVRIDSACRLLHHSELTITSIAEECGFSDRYYFTRVFTELINVSPALYRKKLFLQGN